MSDERRSRAAKGPRRTALYVPASNPRALGKARGLAADCLILDLEDAVAPGDKDAARAAAVAALGGPRETVIRVNAAGTPWHAADMAAARKADAILLPKVRDAADIAAARALAGDTALWAMIETPRAVLNAAGIADSGVQCLVFGANDLGLALELRPRADRANLATALSLIVLAARAAGIAALDGVHNDLGDMEGFRVACEQARDFGFDGKSVIHPSQIAMANAVFTPSDEEIAQARRILAAFDANPGAAVVTLNRRMLEALDADSARRILARVRPEDKAAEH